MIGEDLSRFLLGMGATVVGYADVGILPPNDRRGLPFGISIGVALAPSIVAGNIEGPTPRYYAEYERINKLLAGLSVHGASFLIAQGFHAVGLPPTGIGYDERTLTAPFQHKTAATRAGLGWIGKCALLIMPRYGSAMRLCTILTDAPLPPAEPVTDSCCPDDCRACVDACPARAPVGVLWKAGMPRDALYHASACQATATARTMKNIGVTGTVCGICMAVCPFTRRYVHNESGTTPFAPCEDRAPTAGTL